ncbi:hypothetical protein BGW39_007234 [Mortierella sp. 14UC]|nr:hypothetical protein BGW39_007234 [Mortierella sp. 14UC]
MARGIPSSPKRSQRNGQTKSKKAQNNSSSNNSNSSSNNSANNNNNKVDDDGGQTRCVCEQEHHMGVMIQCETCKVWQHCPCVGLGDGQVTPDKYYCDSCRPENHPYHVVDGVLMTNAENTSSVVASLKVKSPKTKSSGRESKVSTDRDNQSDSATAEYNHLGNGTRASKRRKKTDSTLDDLDHAPFHSTNNSSSSSSSANSPETDDESETTPAPVTTKTSKKATAADREKSAGSAGGSSKSTASKRKKGAAVAAYELSAATASSIVVTTMTPISDQSEESLPNGDQDSESATSASTSAAPSTRRNARSTTNKKNSRTAPADDVQETIHMVPASKRRRTAESNNRGKEESAVETEDEDKASDKDSTPAESAAEAPATRSRKGHSTRANKKTEPVDDEQTESSTPAKESPSAVEDTPKADSAVPEVTKRGGALRRAHQNHGHHHHHSRHGSPSGTPQPSHTIIIHPTKIKYPSARMTIPDMNKRIKQLLEYVGHAQAEMTELKKNRKAAAAAAMERANVVAIAAAACEDAAMADVVNGSTSSSESQPAWLSTPPRSVHEPSRSESLDPMTQPSSSMTTTTEQKQDSPVMQGGSRRGAGGQAPMTPPPQNESGSCNTNAGNMNCDVIGSKEMATGTASASAVNSPVSASISCLEQINKLTHDLLHFQQKFGNKSYI